MLAGAVTAWIKLVDTPHASPASTVNNQNTNQNVNNNVNKVTRVVPKRPAPNVAAPPNDAFNKDAVASAINEIKTPPLTPKAHFRSELREVLAGFQSDWDLAQQHDPNIRT